MAISLHPNLEKRIQEKVESGEYASASEVVFAALEALEAWNRTEEEQLEWLRQEYQKGLESFERNGGIPLDEAFAEIDAIIEKHRK